METLIFDGKMISQWKYHIPAIIFDKGMGSHTTRIKLFYFDDNFRCIAQWVLAFSLALIGQHRTQAGNKLTAGLNQTLVGIESQCQLGARD